MRKPASKTSAVVALISAAILLAGCSPATAPQPSSGTAASTQAALAPSIQQGQSIWQLGEGTDAKPLPDDDADVQAVQKAVALLAALVDQRTAETIESTLTAERGYYTAAFLKTLDDAKYAANTTDLYVKNKLATSSTAIAWYTSTISADRSTATAEVDSTFQFTAGEADYLTKNQLALSTAYTQHRTFTLVKQDGTWKIDNIVKMPLSRPKSK